MSDEIDLLMERLSKAFERDDQNAIAQIDKELDAILSKMLPDDYE